MRYLFSFFLLVLLIACRTSMPNPVLGTWQPDSNKVVRIVFSDSMQIHKCSGVTTYPYRIENNGKELIVIDSAGNERVFFLYLFEDKMLVSENNNRVIFEKL